MAPLGSGLHMPRLMAPPDVLVLNHMLVARQSPAGANVSSLLLLL